MEWKYNELNCRYSEFEMFVVHLIVDVYWGPLIGQIWSLEMGLSSWVSQNLYNVSLVNIMRVDKAQSLKVV